MSRDASRLNPNLLIGFVSPGDFVYGMSRMLQSLSEDTAFRMQVFRDRASAEEWIRAELGDQ